MKPWNHFLNFRYVPSSLFLAIQELDEKHVGTFSFRTRDGFLKVRWDSTHSIPIMSEQIRINNLYVSIPVSNCKQRVFVAMHTCVKLCTLN